LIWEKSWQILAFGVQFGLSMRLVGDGGILFIEVEAESHRARVKLADSSGTLLMVRDFVQLKLGMSSVEFQDGHLKSARLQISAVVGPVAKLLVDQHLVLLALDERLVSDEIEVRAEV
ncbi:MAG TPA: hypothetical protein VHV08_04710, partial [Pirellulales bacterium]|nr:hypothetical protein [Pirellulales bacterium]